MREIIDIVHVQPENPAKQTLPERYRKINNISRKKAEISNRRTMGRILKDSIRKGHDRVIILEDDAEFVTGAEIVLESILSNLPESADICYLGCYIRSCPKESLEPAGCGLFKFTGTKGYRIWGAHAVLYTASGMKLMADYYDSHTDLADAALVNHGIKNGEVYIINPVICNQRHTAMYDIQFGSGMHGAFNFPALEAKTDEFLKTRIKTAGTYKK